VPEQLLPAPASVWQSLRELWAAGDLQSHLGFSASRVAWSLAIGGSVGLLLGFGMGLSRTLRAYLYPSFNVAAQFPVLGWVPLLIIFAGIDEGLKISAISIAVVVPVTINTLKGIANIPPHLLEVSRVYRFSLAQVLIFIVIPQAWRVILPPTFAFFLSFIKDSALASQLGVVELTYSAKVMNNKGFSPELGFGAALVLYFIISYPLARLGQYMEKRLGISQHRRA